MPRPEVVVPVQTRFADLDPLGHVNHVVFFTYMETARTEWMRQHGGALRGGVLVARSECDHRAEIRADVRSVEVTCYVEKVGRTSFVIRHDLVADGVEVGVGRTVQVAIGDDRRPRPISDEERAALLG